MPTTTNDPTDDPASEPLQELAKTAPDIPVPPAQGIGAIALTLALKYHDIGTVQDGLLYQQMKLEGKNLMPLHLDMVFETAKKMELHLIGTSERIQKLILNTLEVVISEDEADAIVEADENANKPETGGGDT
jgi:hypothetical protein